MLAPIALFAVAIAFAVAAAFWGRHEEGQL